MTSKCREQCGAAVLKFSEQINSKINSGDLLYVGIAGDPIGGEYSPLFKNLKIKTFDIGKEWNPDIVGDITKTNFENETWDVIVCVQTIEHIPNLWDLPNEVHRILKPNGYLIIDCPWDYPCHAVWPHFGDFWRITGDGMRALLGSKFKIIESRFESNNTSALFQKV